MVFEGLRSIFFEDQDVFDKDLNNIEYTKIKTIRDSLKACIKQPGVAISSLSEPDLKVIGNTVNPGSAIDKYGRIIYVPEDTSVSGSISTDPYYHPAWPSRTASGSGDYINIYYDVQYDISENNDSGTPYYTRAYDSYRILRESSVSSEESGGICLASGGSDCRPLLLPRGAVEAISMVDEVWLGITTGGGKLWWGGGTERIVAQISYKHLGGAYLNILLSIQVSSGVGEASFNIKLCESLTGVIVAENYLLFDPGDSGYYSIILPISSLPISSLYYLEFSYYTWPSTIKLTVNNVSVYVT